MMTAAQIAAHIEEMAPLVYQESYDNAGFCVGNPDMEVKSVLLCVDVTEAVINEAVRSGANMIISHHPVIFKGLKRITGANYVERIVSQAIKNDIVLYAAHTNLDIASHGVSWEMAKQIDLQDIKVLSPKSVLEQTVGLGVVGNLPKAMPVNNFFDLLKKVFDVPYLRHSYSELREIQRVALCGGSGAFLLEDAVRAGAHLLISADFKYHDFFDADQRIIITDIGHYESEKGVLCIFYELLTKKIPNFVGRITEEGFNPVVYY
jgi:dinuclear metal center YbgI/SA1388 family protein